MKKIISVSEAIKLSAQQKSQDKQIVVAGGCFDILHSGHIFFLESAKRTGDVLFVFLESDYNVKKRKGKDRPVNIQQDRARYLSQLESVDYIIMLPKMTKDADYDKLVFQIDPNIIAATKKDPAIEHKIRQAKRTGVKIEYVVDRIKNLSTTEILERNNNAGSIKG